MATNQLLRDALASEGITQRRLAQLTGVPQGRISDYVHDRYQVSLPQLDRLLAPLNRRVLVSAQPILERREEQVQYRLHRALVDRLLRDPGDYKDVARKNIARSRELVRGTVAHGWLDEWERLAEGPLDELLDVCLRPDEHGVVMRQVSPFAGLLSDDERVAAIRQAAAA